MNLIILCPGLPGQGMNKFNFRPPPRRVARRPPCRRRIAWSKSSCPLCRVENKRSKIFSIRAPDYRRISLFFYCVFLLSDYLAFRKYPWMHQSTFNFLTGSIFTSGNQISFSIVSLGPTIGPIKIRPVTRGNGRTEDRAFGTFNKPTVSEYIRDEEGKLLRYVGGG